MKTVQAIGVGFGLAIGFAGACAALVMCGTAAIKSSDAKPAAELTVPSEQQQTSRRVEGDNAEPTEPRTTAAAPTQSATLSVAYFKDDVLAECVDYAWAVRPGNTAEASETVEKLAAKVLGQKVRSGELIRLKMTCDEQFVGRPVLGACSMPQLTETQFAVSSRHYSAELVADSDVAMRDCLKMGGSWAANPDPDAVRRAKLNQRLKQIDKLTSAQ